MKQKFYLYTSFNNYNSGGTMPIMTDANEILNQLYTFVYKNYEIQSLCMYKEYHIRNRQPITFQNI